MKTKPFQLSKAQIARWKRDPTILIVVKCVKCGLIHVIKSRFYTYNCFCGQNLIYCQTINYVGSKILHKHKELNGDSLKKYF